MDKHAARFDGALARRLLESLKPVLVELFEKMLEGISAQPAPEGAAAGTKGSPSRAAIESALDKALEGK